MSYTPDEQLLEARCIAAVNALDEVAKAIMARLLSRPNDWSKEHLEELKVLHREVTDMQIRLHEVAEKNR